MLKFAFALVALLFPSVALGQVAYPPSVTSGDLAAIQSSMCLPAAAVPPPETVGGAAGSGQACRLANAVQPRITRTASCAITVANGIGSCSALWDGSGFAAGTTIRLAGAPAVTQTGVGAASDQPITCNAYGLSVTGVSFRCWQGQASVVALLGFQVLPFTTSAAGVTVQVVAIPTS